MKGISVDGKLLEDKILAIRQISSGVGRICDDLTTIRYELDDDIRYGRGINGKIVNLCKDLNDLEQDVYDSAHVLDEAVMAYHQAEQELIANLDTILDNNEIKPNQPTTEKKDNQNANKNIPPLSGTLVMNSNKKLEEVRLMQKRLNELGYRDANGNKLAEDGYFGKLTLSAVNFFKEHNKLWNHGEYAGKVGPTTWEYLFAKVEPIIIDQKPIDPKPIVSQRAGGNPSYTEIVNYIESECKKKGLPTEIGLAIAWTESSMSQYNKHGKALSGKNKRKDGTVSSTDWGIMQINDKAWGDRYDFDRIRSDWKYNVSCGLDIALYSYKKVQHEENIPRATYCGYNSGSNYDRYRTENDGRDTNFYNYYQNKPWIEKVNTEVPLEHPETELYEPVEEPTNPQNPTDSAINNANIIESSTHNMTLKSTQGAVKPKYILGEGAKTPETYNQIINQFEVEKNPRYQKNGNITYCNIFAWDVSLAMGVELPRFVEINEIGNVEDATGKAIGRHYGAGYRLYGHKGNENCTELNADRLAIWLEAQGANHGWRKITPEEAQRRANEGYMTISAIMEPGSKVGHVQVIRPTPNGETYDAAKGVYLAQAGGSNSNGLYFKDKYSSQAYYERYSFYTHD